MTENRKEIRFLYILFIFTSSIIWTLRIGWELKVAFSSVLFIMVLGFAFIFIELGKVKNP